MNTRLKRNQQLRRQARRQELVAASIVVIALAIGFYVIAAMAAHDAEVQR